MRHAQKFGSAYDPKTRAANARPYTPPWGSTVTARDRLNEVLRDATGTSVRGFYNGETYHVVDKLRVERIPHSAEFRWHADIYEYGPQDVTDPNFGFVYTVTKVIRQLTVTCTGHTLPVEEFTTKFQLLFGM